MEWGQIQNGMIYLRKTKTDEPREIPINDALQVIFDDLKKNGEPSNVKRLDGKKVLMPNSKTDHVFTYQGASVKNVRKSFVQALKTANIEDFRFHDLRHTFASHLVMNGATIKDVQEFWSHRAESNRRHPHYE